MQRKHNKHAKHDHANTDRSHGGRHHRRHKKENDENAPILENVTRPESDCRRDNKVKLKVRYRHDDEQSKNADNVKNDKLTGLDRKKHRKDRSVDKQHNDIRTSRQSSEKLGSIENYLTEVKNRNGERFYQKNTSSCSLNPPKLTKKPLRKEKTIHIEKDIEHHNKKPKSDREHHRSNERDRKHIKDVPQQVMYCQIETKTPFNQEYVHPGNFYRERRREDTKKRKHSRSDRQGYLQKESSGKDHSSKEKKRRHHHHHHHHHSSKNVDDNKKIKELYVHADKKRKYRKAGLPLKNNDKPAIETQQKEVADEVMKSYFTKIQEMIDKKLDALLHPSKSKEKITENKDVNKFEHDKKHERNSIDRERKLQSRRRKSHEPLYVSRNSLSDSSIHIKKPKSKSKDPPTNSSRDRDFPRRKSNSQERTSPHRRCHTKENDFRVQGIEPAELLQQQGAIPKRRHYRNLECKTVSIIGIPSQVQEKSIILNHTQTSTSLKYMNSDEDCVEKKKKTKRFKLYYKYSLDNNACVSDNSSDAHSLLSDSCRVISAPSEESSDTCMAPNRHSSHPRTKRRDFIRPSICRDHSLSEKLTRRHQIRDTSAKLNNIVEERTTSTSEEHNNKRLYTIHDSNSEYGLNAQKNNKFSKHKEKHYKKYLQCEMINSHHKNRRKRKFVSKSDVNISYESLCRVGEKEHLGTTASERFNVTKIPAEKLKQSPHKYEGESISQGGREDVLTSLKEISKEYKEHLFRNQTHASNLIDLVSLNESFKYLPQLVSLRNLLQFQEKNNTRRNERTIAVGKDNMTQTSLSLSVGIEAEKKQEKRHNIVTEDKDHRIVQTVFEFPAKERNDNKDASIEANPLQDPRKMKEAKSQKGIGNLASPTEAQKFKDTVDCQNDTLHLKNFQDKLRYTKIPIISMNNIKEKKFQRQPKKLTEKKAVIYRYKKHGKIAKLPRDFVNAETRTRDQYIKPPKNYHCIALNTSFDRIEQRCVCLNTSFVDEAQQRSSIDNSDDDTRISKSETSLHNHPQMEKEDSKVASLMCLHKINEDKFTVSTKSNAQSLDHYSGKLLGDQPHTSRLFLTKQYKTSEVPAYQRRKNYDENIRKKLRKKSQFAQQIFEVRFLQVDKVPNAKKTSIHKIDEACSPINIHEEESTLHIPTRCLKRALMKSLRKELLSQNISYKLNIKNVEHSDPVKQLTDSQGSSSVTNKESQNTCFCFKSSCNLCRNGFVDFSSDTISNKALVDTDDSKIINDTSSFSIDNSFLNAPKNLSTNDHLSCPVLNHIDPSFDFLYETDSSIRPNGHPKKPTILGYALKSETALRKVAEKTSVQKYDQISEGLASSEESGYSSRKSCSSFFKQPLIADLLRPSGEMQAHPNGFDVYNSMSQKCKEYAYKVRAHSDSKMNDIQHYEEIPLEVLVSQQDLRSCDSKCCLTSTSLNTNELSSKESLEIPILKLDDETRTESEMSLKTNDIKTNSSSFLCNMLDKKLLLSSTNLNKLCITFVDANVVESPNNREFNFNNTTSNTAEIASKSSKINLRSSKENPERMKKVLIKNFFENLLAVYEREIGLCMLLYQDENFFSNVLLATVQKNVTGETSCLNTKISMKKLWSTVKKIFGIPKRKKNSMDGRVDFSCDTYKEKSGTIEKEHQETLQALAHSTRKYFSMYVQAVKINRDINDEMKTCGFLKLLERIEKGQFTFLKSRDAVNFEEDMRCQVKQSFHEVYEIAKKKAEGARRDLSHSDIRLIGAFVSKYRIGLLSTTDIIGSCIGRGIVKTEKQLKDAVTYLIRQPCGEMDLDAFEDFCTRGYYQCAT